jgi:AcrR family transcriptional regulator
MAVKRYHHGDLRSALVTAALDRLEIDGALPTWRALARACGVSHNAPTRHFASYDELKTAVAAECYRRLAAHIESALRARDPHRRLAAGMRAYIDFGLQHPAWYRLMFRGVAPESRELGRASADAFAILVRGVAACGVASPFAVAVTAWFSQHGCVDVLLLGLMPKELEEDDEALIGRTIQMTMDYVRSVAQKVPSR